MSDQPFQGVDRFGGARQGFALRAYAPRSLPGEGEGERGGRGLPGPAAGHAHERDRPRLNAT
ncbi:hypothetical protein GCM10022284_73840 [Streptomyces hundungensis]